MTLEGYVITVDDVCWAWATIELVVVDVGTSILALIWLDKTELVLLIGDDDNDFGSVDGDGGFGCVDGGNGTKVG